MWSSANKCPKHIPKSTGPYIPGCVDVLTDYSVEGLFLRFYYPTDKTDQLKQNDHKRWWPCIPDGDYIEGFTNVLQIPSFVIRSVLWKYGAHYTPAQYGAKIRSKSDKKFKCILFSHGLGAHRSFYNCICTELASRGYLVIVLEHRDSSPCYSYYYKSKEDAASNNRTHLPYVKIDFGKDHYRRRYEQVNKRTNECLKALDFVLNLNKGIVPHNVFDDTANQTDFELSDLIGKIDVDTITMAGQSFGGGSALFALSKRSELKQGVVFDPWMFPIKEDNLEAKINKPILFVNTQTFHIRANVKAMEKFLSDERNEMYTILHSTHENQTDSVFIVGSWLNWFMKKIDPTVGIKINNYLVLDFLQRHTKDDADISDCREFLKREAKNYYNGLTVPWA